MLKKLFILIYLIIVAALIYYVASFFFDRQEENEEEILPTDRAKSRIEKIFTNDQKTIEKEIGETQNSKEKTEEETDPREEVLTTNGESAYNITREDCDNECINYEKDGEELNYCKNVCGLTGQVERKETCDNLSKLKKDYCIRDTAVQENDLKKCNNISDGGIKKQCTNRIQEDIIDEIM